MHIGLTRLSCQTLLPLLVSAVLFVSPYDTPQVAREIIGVSPNHNVSSSDVRKRRKLIPFRGRI